MIVIADTTPLNYLVLIGRAEICLGSLGQSRLLGPSLLRRARFADSYHPVGADVFQHLHRTAGPLDFDFLHAFCLAQPEMHAVMAGRSVPDGAGHLIVLVTVASAVSGGEPNARADAIAIAARPFEAERNPVIALGA